MMLAAVDYWHWTVWLALIAGILTTIMVFASGAVMVHRYLRSWRYNGPERRASARRADNPVDVLITDADRQLDPFPGIVHDRSRDGLCIVLDRELVVGTVLQVLPDGASPEVDWVLVEVRHCGKYRVKKNGVREKVWRVGCKFLKPPPWAVFRQFG